MLKISDALGDEEKFTQYKISSKKLIEEIGEKEVKRNEASSIIDLAKWYVKACNAIGKQLTDSQQDLIDSKPI